MKIFLVRPHPPLSIMNRACPIPEDYKYNWQPMALKVVAWHLQKALGTQLEIKIWHLMNPDDDEKLEEALREQRPEVVLFSEIDILVNEVSRLAALVKKLLPGTWTLVGGKQTSLLREGDSFPFHAIDFAVRGEGIDSIYGILTSRLKGTTPSSCPALVQVDDRGIVTGPIGYDSRKELSQMDGIELQRIPVENHTFQEYLESCQMHPALVQDKSRTASLFAGSGCPHQCVFCQSPVEYGRESHAVKVRPPEKAAEEIAWLVHRHQVNNIFSLEANLDLENWLKTYACLEQLGIQHIAVSGFIRALDILNAHRKGILEKLASKGMRVLSIGLDVPFHEDRDVYNKAFSHSDMLECLKVCASLGILVMGTFIGDPSYTALELRDQLQALQELPIAAVDIRLSIALRNTEYFQQMSPWMIYHPEKDHRYFDRQNYRYQTIRIPGKVTPRQTYRLVRSFHRQFLTSDKHLAYVLRFAECFPESTSYFRRQYNAVAKNVSKPSAKLQELIGLLGLNKEAL